MFGEKLQKLRRENNMTQEQLADYLEVSRQSVSKWESDIAYPETDKIIKMVDLFKVTTDYLLRDGELKEESPVSRFISKMHYEYKSKRKLFGVPLVHVNIGVGLYKAKGIISIGILSKGFISIGMLSLGLLSIGIFSLGLLAIGNFALGIFAVGAIAVGIIAIGAIAIGLYSIGALAIGCFSKGALACGKYVAIGDYAYAEIAIADTQASGTFEIMKSSMDEDNVRQLIDENVPSMWSLFKIWIKGMI